MKIPKECHLCGNKKLEVRKTYCGIKTYYNGKTVDKRQFKKVLADTTIYCNKCGKEESI